MMEQYWFTFLASILTGIVTLTGIIVSNRQLVKREVRKSLEERKREIAKKEIDTLAEVYLILSEIQDECSITSSFIDIDGGLRAEEFNLRFKNGLARVRELRRMVDLMFPDYLSHIEEIERKLTYYWAGQRILLKTEVADDSFQAKQIAVITAANEVGKITGTVKNRLADLNQTKRESYILLNLKMSRLGPTAQPITRHCRFGSRKVSS